MADTPEKYQPTKEELRAIHALQLIMIKAACNWDWPKEADEICLWDDDPDDDQQED